MASEGEFSPGLRLHPLSWLFVLVASVKQLIVPIVAFVIFGVRDGSLWGVIAVVPLLAIALRRQFLFRYGFGPSGLVFRDGLFFRSVRQIEYDRIENIDTERGILHRLFDVAEVRVESSTGGKPEATIRVLGLEAVRELRERVFGEARSEPVATQARTADEVLLRLGAPELMRYGFVDNRGLLVIAAVIGVLSQAGAMQGAGLSVGQWMRSSYASEVGALGVSVFLVALGVLLTLLLCLRLLSLLWAVVMLHDFTLTRSGSDLRLQYGLLTRVALTLRLPRIQAAHRVETVLHRLFDRVSLSVDLAGGGVQDPEKGSARTKVRWLAPICTPDRAAQLAVVALPMLASDEPPRWQTLAQGARARLFRKTLALAALFGTAPAVLLMKSAAIFLLLLIVPLAWLHATQSVRHARWALTREALFFQRGWLTRRLSIVPRNRVQVVRVIASPFDRRSGMATLAVDTAGAGTHSSIIRIPYLPAERAREVAPALYGSVTA